MRSKMLQRFLPSIPNFLCYHPLFSSVVPYCGKKAKCPSSIRYNEKSSHRFPFDLPSHEQSGESACKVDVQNQKSDCLGDLSLSDHRVGSIVCGRFVEGQSSSGASWASVRISYHFARLFLPRHSIGVFELTLRRLNAWAGYCRRH